jgi:phage tail-like protein
MNGNGLRSHFFHLNADGSWGPFSWRGLELGGDGGLALASLPRPSAPVPAEVREAPSPEGPAGVAVTPDGTLYFTDPDRDLLLRVALCDPAARPAPCAGGTGEEPGRFRLPRGLAYHRVRDALIVADSGHHRLQLLDAAAGRVLGSWGQGADPFPSPSAEPGRFDTPWAVTVDRDGYTYVVDHGNRRIQKLDLDGRPVDGFLERQADAGLVRPVDVAAWSTDRVVEIHVLDPDASALVVLDAEGSVLRRMDGAAPTQAMGLAVDRSGVFLGDNVRRGLLRVLPDGDRAGHAAGYDGPVSALALEGDRRLWLHPGSGGAPIPFATRGSFGRRGALWGGPFAVDEDPHEWHELRALGAPPPDGAGVEFYVFLADDPSADPGEPAGPAAEFPAGWQRLPQRGFHGLIPGKSRHLWVGARLVGDGSGTGRIEQVRIDFDGRTWVEHLPAVYRKDPESRREMEALLALSESLFREVEETVRDLPLLFDPGTAPQSWLDWLAGWLALHLPEGWSESRKRAAIARAFQAYGGAGTRTGLREAVRFHTGLHAVIEEPIRGGDWWLLPVGGSHNGDLEEGCGCADRRREEGCGCAGSDCCGREASDAPVRGSRLGFSTVLAPAQADGAIVGTTAVADRSHLTTGAEYGAPLFDDVAYRFTVSLYGGPGLTEDALAGVRRVLDREKPAHTAYEICTIEPRMRVGYQSTIGIDTVLPPDAADREPDESAGGLRLGGEPVGQIGVRARVGAGARLG